MLCLAIVSVFAAFVFAECITECSDYNFKIDVVFNADIDMLTYTQRSTTGYNIFSYDPSDLAHFESLIVASGNIYGGSHCLPCGEYFVQGRAINGYIGNVTVSTSETVQFVAEDDFTAFSVHLNETCEIPITSAPTVLCDSSEFTLDIIIDVDDNPDETSWSVFSAATGQVIAASSTLIGTPVDGSFEDDVINSLGGARVCLNSDEDYIFSIADCGGDGICCGSGFGEYVLANEYTGIIASGGQFGFGEQVYFKPTAPG